MKQNFNIGSYKTFHSSLKIVVCNEFYNPNALNWCMVSPRPQLPYMSSSMLEKKKKTDYREV